MRDFFNIHVNKTVQYKHINKRVIEQTCQAYITKRKVKFKYYLMSLRQQQNANLNTNVQSVCIPHWQNHTTDAVLSPLAWSAEKILDYPGWLMFLGLIDGVFSNLATQLAVHMPRQLGFREKKKQTQKSTNLSQQCHNQKTNCPHRLQIESHFLKASKLYRERSKH